MCVGMAVEKRKGGFEGSFAHEGVEVVPLGHNLSMICELMLNRDQAWLHLRLKCPASLADISCQCCPLLLML